MADVKQQTVDETRVAKSPDEQRLAAEQKTAADFIAEALSRWQTASDAESSVRRDALDDLEFRTGKQWPADIQSQRAADARPCLTMNRLPQFTRQVTNEYRQNRPAVQISPVGDSSDLDTAKFLQAMARYIERNSDADVAYDTAFESMVIGGSGYVRLTTDYSHDKTFDQDIFIRRIKNSFLVYFDPSCVEADYSDAHWAFIIEDLDMKEYKKLYPKSKAASLSSAVSVGDTPPSWLSKDSIRIAEYFYVEEKRRTLYRLADGFILWKDIYDKIPEDGNKPLMEAYREVLVRTVHWAKINALEVLEKNIWPGTWIPIIPFLGEDFDVNGKRYLAGLVRHAKDPQRMYNFWVSAATETVALAPRSPYVAAEGQLEGYEGVWSQANVRNFATLTYKPVTIGGQQAPPPQRNAAEPPIQAMSLMTRQADNDLKATMGIYDASLGERGPEQSGKAILARQRQGSLSTLNFSDNGNRAIRFIGKQLVDLIPKIYDAPRVLRIEHPDGSIEEAAIYNSQTTGLDKEKALAALKNPGVKKIYDVGVGRYDVSISAGPSYQTKRQEAMESMTELVRAYPNLMGLVGDLLVRQMDWPYAQEIADRLKKALPPEMQDAGEGDPKGQVIKLQGQLKMLMEQHALLVQELNSMSEEMRTKRMELESKKEVALIQAQTDLLKEEVKIRGEAALAILTAKIADIQGQLLGMSKSKDNPESGGVGGEKIEGGQPTAAVPTTPGAEGTPPTVEPPIQ